MWQNGLSWYARAHAQCVELAAEFNLPLNLVIGIVAVLSPQTKWTENIRYARNSLLVFTGQVAREDITIGVFPDNLAKAQAMFLTGEVFPHLSGDKVVSFYHNMLDPYGRKYVTIDRHAIQAWQGRYDGGGSSATTPGYELISECYRKVAAEFNIAPCQAQAIAWVQWRFENNIND